MCSPSEWSDEIRLCLGDALRAGHPRFNLTGHRVNLRHNLHLLAATFVFQEMLKSDQEKQYKSGWMPFTLKFTTKNFRYIFETFVMPTINIHLCSLW